MRLILGIVLLRDMESIISKVINFLINCAEISIGRAYMIRMA